MGYNPGTVSLDIDDTEFTNNTSASGAGLWTIYFETVNITGSTFDFNIATVEAGGILLSGFETATIDTSTISNNSAPLAGGLSFSGTEISLSNLLFYNNDATTSHGGAIACDNQTEMNLINSTFSENSAVRYGGAIYLDSAESATTYLANLTLYKNTTEGDGGGLYLGFDNTVYVTRTVFDQNTDKTLRGNCEHPGTITSEGYNRATETSCNLIDDADDTITDAGGSGCTGTDQRGASWPVDGDASTTAECDIGAVEYGSTP